MRELDTHRDELKELEEMIIAGADPAQLSTWKSPVELNMPQPTRGQVILWGRKVRDERFEATESGRDIVQAAFVDNGLMKDPKTNKYLMYSEREKAKVAKAAAAKGDKRKRKRGAAKKKAAKQVMTFKSVIGMAGFDFGPCEHELEL